MHDDSESRAAMQRVLILVVHCLTELAERRDERVLNRLSGWPGEDAEGLPPELRDITDWEFRTARRHLVRGDIDHAEDVLQGVARKYRSLVVEV
jgi:hypothetical protein